MATTVTLKPNAIDLSGSTSGTTTLQATAVAGTTTITLPAATDTLVGKATTDTLTNKTLTGAVMNGTLGATTPSTVAATTISASSTATFAAGAVGTPSITTDGDTNTGIFFPAADTIAFSEGGAEVMRIDSDGEVGIGTTSPNTKLQVSVGSNGSGVVNTLRLQNVGTSAGDGARILFTAGTSTDGAGIASTGVALDSADLRFYTGGSTERMRINTSGKLLIGTTTVGGLGTTIGGNQGDNFWISNTSSSSGYNHIQFKINSTDVGQIQTSGSSTAYQTSSDYRLKENIQPMQGALAKVSQLKPVTYKWKIDGSDGQGFIAHELQEIIPDCVGGTKDATRQEEYEVTQAVKDEEGNITTPAVMGTRTVPVYQGIDTSFLVATLTAAIQELKAVVDAQATRIATLEAK
jgi:hypothetical protein